MHIIQLSKEAAIDAIDRFDRKYILYIPFYIMLRNIIIMNIVLNNATMLYYNSMFEYFDSLLKFSWNKTPCHIQILLTLFEFFIAVSYGYYIYFVNVYGSLKTRINRADRKRGFSSDEDDEASDDNEIAPVYGKSPFEPINYKSKNL